MQKVGVVPQRIAPGDICPVLERGTIETACTAATDWMLAQYDWKNVDAMYRLVAEGVQLRQFPNEVIETLYHPTQEVLAEQSAANPQIKTLLDSQTAFRDRHFA